MLSGSADSNVHVWSIPALLSFTSALNNSHVAQLTPLRSLSSHRAAVTSITIGHGHWSTNIALSAALDKTCRVWDYRIGDLLHTFLLPQIPLCLALDPADRAMYAGLEDGSIQSIDFYKQSPFEGLDGEQHGSHTPSQPLPSEHWRLPPETSSQALCLAVSYDGTTILSGHDDGKVFSWDVAKGRYAGRLLDLQVPVTNLQMMQPEGFPKPTQGLTMSLNVIKAKYENALTARKDCGGLSVVPDLYASAALSPTNLTVPRILQDRESDQDSLMGDFDTALSHSSFPSALLDQCTAAFSVPSRQSEDPTGVDEDVRREIDLLRSQLAHSRAAQLAHAERAVELNSEVLRLRDREEARLAADREQRIKNGEADQLMRENYMDELKNRKAGAQTTNTLEIEKVDVSQRD